MFDMLNLAMGISLITITAAIDLLPCTENANQQIVARARNIIEEHTPPGYQLLEVVPQVTLGRNPHRWIASFTRNDNHYEYGCAYFVCVKQDFKRVCPPGSEIRTVSLQDRPNQQCIVVEVLVNCPCEKNPRRRRRYLREPSMCSFMK